MDKERDYEDIDLSGVTIYEFLHIQGMRGSRVREIYRLCINDIIPQPTPVIFKDETDRERHALRSFRNAFSIDLVPNVQFAFQQRALKDDGLGMTPEELQELKQSNLQPTEGEGCQAEERCATQAPVEQMPGFRFNRALLNEDPRAIEKQLKTSSKLGNMKDKRQTQAPVSRLVRRYENTSSIDLRVNAPKAASTQRCRSAKATTAFSHQASSTEPKPKPPLTASQRNNIKPATAVPSVRKQAPVVSQASSKIKSTAPQITAAAAAKDRGFATLSRTRAQRVPLSFSSTTSATQTPPPELPVRRWR